MNYNLHPIKFKVGNTNFCIEERIQRDNNIKWAIVDKTYNNMVLTKGLYPIYEPLPSSRDEEYLNFTRFDTIEDAVDTIKKYYMR